MSTISPILRKFLLRNVNFVSTLPSGCFTRYGWISAIHYSRCINNKSIRCARIDFAYDMYLRLYKSSQGNHRWHKLINRCSTINRSQKLICTQLMDPLLLHRWSIDRVWQIYTPQKSKTGLATRKLKKYPKQKKELDWNVFLYDFFDAILVHETKWCVYRPEQMGFCGTIHKLRTISAQTVMNRRQDFVPDEYFMASFWRASIVDYDVSVVKDTGHGLNRNWNVWFGDESGFVLRHAHRRCRV